MDYQDERSELAWTNTPRRSQPGRMLVALCDTTIEGEPVLAGITRVAHNHPWLRKSELRALFVATSSAQGKAAIARGSREPAWLLR